MGKTKPYTKKAVDNYRAKHDFISLTLPLDFKQRMRSVGMTNKDAAEIVIAEVERLEHPEIEEVEPDEWDLAMIEEAKRENDGTYITFDELLESEGLTYDDL